MEPLTCHPDMPAVGTAYCAGLAPETLALITDACEPRLRTRHMIGVESGLIWAAARAVDRGEAICPAFGTLGSAYILDSFCGLFRDHDSDTTPEMLECIAGRNLLTLLPPRRGISRPLVDLNTIVSPGGMIAAIIAEFEFRHAANHPFFEASMDVRRVHDQLREPGGFVSAPALTARGRPRGDRMAIYHRACELAAYVGEWLIRDQHVAVAVCEFGATVGLVSDPDQVRRDWFDHVNIAVERVTSGGCCPLVAFPGPRPWTPSACALLGVLRH